MSTNQTKQANDSFTHIPSDVVDSLRNSAADKALFRELAEQQWTKAQLLTGDPHYNPEKYAELFAAYALKLTPVLRNMVLTGDPQREPEGKPAAYANDEARARATQRAKELTTSQRAERSDACSSISTEIAYARTRIDNARTQIEREAAAAEAVRAARVEAEKAAKEAGKSQKQVRAAGEKAASKMKRAAAPRSNKRKTTDEARVDALNQILESLMNRHAEGVYPEALDDEYSKLRASVKTTLLLAEDFADALAMHAGRRARRV